MAGKIQFCNRRVLACLEQRLKGGIYPRGILLDPTDASLLSLKARATDASKRFAGTPLARITGVFQAMQNHYALNGKPPDASKDDPQLIHELFGETAISTHRSILFKWLCDEILLSSGVRCRLMVGKLHTPALIFPHHHVWVDITLDEGSNTTFRVDATRSSEKGQEPILPVSFDGQTSGISEKFQTWFAQSVMVSENLGVQRDEGAIDDLVAFAAEAHQLESTEICSTANAFYRLGLHPESIQPLYLEIKKRIRAGTAKTQMHEAELEQAVGFVKWWESRRDTIDIT
jgi:hypothetical protein